jgi:hypothetical protein
MVIFVLDLMELNKLILKTEKFVSVLFAKMKIYILKNLLNII